MQNEARGRRLLWVQGESDHLSSPWPIFCFSPAACCSSLRGQLYLSPEYQFWTAGDRLAACARPSALRKLFQELRSSRAVVPDQSKVASSHHLVEAAKLGRRLVWPVPAKEDLLQAQNYLIVKISTRLFDDLQSKYSNYP